MTYSEPARRTSGPVPRILVAGVLVVVVAVTAAIGDELPSSSPPATSPIEVIYDENRGASVPGADQLDALVRRNENRGALLPRTEYRDALGPGSEPPGAPESREERRGALSEADGALPDGTTVFDDEIPGVANLDPLLLRALRQAAADAEDDGVEFFVNSGWRSPEYQERLLQEAVSRYGSEREAARWVATPNTSAHVSGDAVDMGFAATAWLSQHGAEYGLCQVYDNELWHYELRPKAVDRGCPPTYADPTHDPRMRQ